LAAEIRALRAARSEAPRHEATAEPRRDQTSHLEFGLAAAGNDILALRSSFDAFSEKQRQEIAELAQAHRREVADLAQTHRKDVADIAHRLDRIEQMVARELTGSVKPTVRRKKVRSRRAAPGRVAGPVAPLQIHAIPAVPAPALAH
jgi:hypothetical protein